MNSVDSKNAESERNQIMSSCFNKGDCVRISNDAPYHAGRVGYFQFLAFGDYGEYNVAVISETQSGSINGRVMFAVNVDDVILVIQSQHVKGLETKAR
jgi:hypothetical protein